MSADTSGNDRDRRSAMREPMRRPVVFAGVRGEGLLRQGMAVDISASGLLIHTDQPDVIGRHLEIELHPDGVAAPGDVVMVRGEVVWARPLSPKGNHAMGVRFLQSMPATDATGAGYRPATREESTNLAASIQKRLANFEPAARVEISGVARQRLASSPPPPVGSPPSRKRRLHRLLALLLLLLGVGILVSLATLAALWGVGLFDTQTRVTVAPPDTEPDTESSPRPQDSSTETSGIVDSRINSIREEGVSYYLNRGNLYLIQGRFPAAAQAFKLARAKPDATSIERFVAELGEAQALASDDKPDEALALLATPFEGAALVPEAWQSLKNEFQAALAAAPTAPAARAPLVSAFDVESVTARGGEGGGEGAGNGTGVGTGDGGAPGNADPMRIEIDTTRHLLSVLENNSIKAVYPIGLGARDRTPEGQFTIVNKIENPDWYNKGDVVPAGDPANQLGSRWLGLGDESGPTPVGIHATDDLDSIGSNQSRGCIRMRPGDVEALFQMVDVGTPVSIRAL